MSVKIVLLKKKDLGDGPYPLTIRISKDRKSSYIFVGQKVLESKWDPSNQRVKKSHPNSARLNNLLLQKLAEANDKLLELEANRPEITAKKVRQGLKSKTGATFFKQAEIYLAGLKQSGKYNQESADKPRVNRFKEFLDGEDIQFNDITPTLLKRFQSYLKKPYKKGEKTITRGDRTVVNHLVVIRSICNQAIKGEFVDSKFYPFGQDKIQIKFPESSKIGLLPEEVKQIEELALSPDSYLNHARNIWLFSFYFAGMRVSDILRLTWADFQNDRLYYSMGKNAKAGSLKIPDKAIKIISQYKDRESKNDLVFPELEILDSLTDKYHVQRKISYAVKKLDEHLPKVAELAGVNKKLTMHIARHTFGNISGDKIPIQMLQKLYRHTSITTTIGYQANFIHKDADEALDAVIGF